MIKKTLLILALLYCISIAAIWLDGATTGYEKSEYAVVLGNQVYPSGEPSERLQARLNRAAELFRDGTVEKIIVSGGLGKEGHDEATVMKQYLEIQGIPPTVLIADSFGNNTRLTAQNAHQWAKMGKSIIVVSQLYHVSRAKMAFEQDGFTHVGVAYPHYFEWRDVYASLRELPAWVSYWLYQPQRYYGWLAHDPASTSFYLLPAKTDSRTACQQGTLRGCVTILYTENVSIELRKMLGNDVTVLGIPMNSIQNDVHSLWILPQEILAGERSNIEIMLYKFKTTE